jgi:hypothetical protein
MQTYAGATPQMAASVRSYEHQGMFFLALQKELTKERMQALCHAMGIQAAGTVEEMCSKPYNFTSALYGRGLIREDKSYSNLVRARDATALKGAAIRCGYNTIVIICNKWMGIDENSGIDLEMHEQTLTSQSAVTTLRNYATIGDILADKNNFGRPVRDLTILLEDGDLWTVSAEKLIEAGIDISVDQ